MKDPAAVKLGRKGGAATKGITSEAKKASSRTNVAKARKAKADKRPVAPPQGESK